MSRKPSLTIFCILTVCSIVLSGPTRAKAEEVAVLGGVSDAIEVLSSGCLAADEEPSMQEGACPTAQPQESLLANGEETVPVQDDMPDDNGYAPSTGEPEATTSQGDIVEGQNAAGSEQDAISEEDEVEHAGEASACDATTDEAKELKAQQDEVSARQVELDAYAASHVGDIPDGIYQIVSKLDEGYSLDVRGGKAADGSGIIIYTAGTQNNQRWEIVHLANGYATIKSVGTGKYLSLKGEDQAYEGGGAAQVIQWSLQSDAPWQQWVIARQQDGYFKLTSALLKMGETRVLDVRGGKAVKSSQIILYADRDSVNQRWAIRVTKDILDNEAKTHKADLKDGTYIIGSALDADYVLNVQRSSVDNGASVMLWQGGPTVNEGFTIVHDQNGYATITGALSGKVLDVRGGKAVDGTTITQWTKGKSGSRNQMWIVTRHADGSYGITSALVGDVRLVLSVAVTEATNGVLARIKSDTGAASPNQSWTINAAPEQYKYAHDIQNGTYVIRTSLDTSKVLDVSGSSVKSGAAVKLWRCTWNINQIWTVTHDNQGFVSIKNENSGMYLAISGGCSVQTADDYKWVVESSSSQRLRLRDAATGKYLDVSRSDTSNGAKVIAYKSGTGLNQKWKFETAVVGLNGVDISGWNTGIDYSKLGNFAIIKATEWNPDTRTYTSYNNYKSQADKALAAGKLIGFYHFATNPTTSGQTIKEQAQGFINAVSVKDSKGNYKYLGKAMLFLDWEDASYSKLESKTAWAKEWLDYVYQKTKVKPMIYMNKNCSVSYNWSSVAKAGYDLWGAQYLDDYYDENPSTMITSFVGSPRLTSGWGAWGKPVIYQYTSTCKLHGSSVYDVNKFYGTAANWKMRAMVK